MRAPAGAALLVAVAVALAGCGSASPPSGPTGVDELTIPTPRPDPDDFVAEVDNRWLPLEPGATWTYDVTGGAADERTVTVSDDRLEVAGVATTAVTTREGPETTTDYFAQDRDGNVWWFGRAGEWVAGEDGALAGLAMPARPRVGDGFRLALAPGVVEDVATVEAVDETVNVPVGALADVVVLEVVDPRAGSGRSERAYAAGVGLVSERTVGNDPVSAVLSEAP
ncbi:hypothetical protein [Nocardioides sp. SYSU D00038]|uniref:hypothetical protein n=1 Tax=Nocardioides sp. SYSU D00038 TaxID=2812554 RepID=UPI0019675E6F|nr:hypothetical protein [Nocardioides sp. SYSU D00038]